MLNITRFANKVVQLAEFRESLHKYLLEKMGSVAPNLSALIGEMVGARLISKAGSLTSLAKAPASTVQILGAEKALFRALKTRGNTPKYGILFNSSFIGKAKSKDKGRMARFLANKCSIASRIDSFREFPTQVFGLKLREQVEDRLKFFESGTLPPKNVDVMRSAVQEAGAQDKIDQSSSTHLVTDNMEGLFTFYCMSSIMIFTLFLKLNLQKQNLKKGKESERHLLRVPPKDLLKKPTPLVLKIHLQYLPPKLQHLNLHQDHLKGKRKREGKAKKL